MAHATSLKLPAALKARIDGVAKASGLTPHAFMVEALERETERAERYESFVEEALQADREMNKTGRYYAADDVFRYAEARAAGKPAKRPRLRTWRR